MRGALLEMHGIMRFLQTGCKGLELDFGSCEFCLQRNQRKTCIKEIRAFA